MTTKITQAEVRQEINRRKSQTARMLEAFQKYGELTTRDLQRIGTGCSSRLHTLRSEGHKIVAVYVKPGFYRYVYLGQVTDGDAE